MSQCVVDRDSTNRVVVHNSQPVEFPSMGKKPVPVPCKGCRKTLFQAMRIAPGRWAMDSEERHLLTDQGGGHYYLCPHCGGRNHVIYNRDEGVLQLVIFSFTPAD